MIFGLLAAGATGAVDAGTASASPRLASYLGGPVTFAVNAARQQKDATGIYRDPAGGLGACLTPEGALPGTDGIGYGKVETVSGAAGAWAWEFVESGTNLISATWPKYGQRITAGPLAGLHDGGADAAASIDQAANIIVPNFNYYDAGHLDHTGKIGPQLADFAKAYPGPWHIVNTFTGKKPLIVGRSYSGKTTVRANNNRIVPVTGLPAALTSTANVKLRVRRSETVGGVVHWTMTPTAAGRIGASIEVSQLAPATATVMGPDGGRGSGLQYLLQAGGLESQTVKVTDSAHVAGYDLYLEKVSANTGKAVAGAVLDVRDVTRGQELPSVTTGTGPELYRDPYGWDGQVPVKDKLRVTEVKAPAGYYIPTEHTRVFTVPKATTTFTLKISDPVTPHPGITTQLTAPSGPGSARLRDAALSSTPPVSATEQILQSGQEVGDTIWVTGDDGENGTITAKMYSVPAPAAGDCTAASWANPTTLATDTLRVNGSDNDGNDSLSVTPVMVTQSGVCVTWVESLTLTPSGATVGTKAGQPAETGLVILPAIRTAVSVQHVAPGVTIHDDAVVTDLYGQKATLGGQLLGPIPAVNRSCAGLNWSGAPVAEQITPQTISGDGTYDVGAYRIPAGNGCYTYVESVTAMTTAGTSSAVNTTPGQNTETALVRGLAVSTQTSKQVAKAGDDLYDSAKVTGMLPGGRAVITDVLKGVTPPANGDCAAVTAREWAHATTLGTATRTVTGNGTYRLGPVKVRRAVCATWVESARQFGVTYQGPAAGTRLETSLVIHPTMHTLTQRAEPNRKLRDRIVVVGLYGQRATIDVKLLLTVASNGGCTAADWRGARVIGQTTITVNHDGRFITEPLGPAYTLHKQTSCTTFVETLLVGGRRMFSTHPGESTETSKIMHPVTHYFEVDTWHMTTQACATAVWNSLDYPYFQYGALDWTYLTAYGRSCFTDHWQVLGVTQPADATDRQWLAAINSRITATGVGHVSTFAPLNHLSAGTITIAWIAPPDGWLKGRPSSDRKPHKYFARS